MFLPLEKLYYFISPGLERRLQCVDSKKHANWQIISADLPNKTNNGYPRRFSGKLRVLLSYSSWRLSQTTWRTHTWESGAVLVTRCSVYSGVAFSSASSLVAVANLFYLRLPSKPVWPRSTFSSAYRYLPSPKQRCKVREFSLYFFLSRRSLSFLRRR